MQTGTYKGVEEIKGSAAAACGGCGGGWDSSSGSLGDDDECDCCDCFLVVSPLLLSPPISQNWAQKIKHKIRYFQTRRTRGSIVIELENPI